MTDLTKVTRLTVVDDTGRAYEKLGVALRFDVQDDGKTLKVFVAERSAEEQAQTRAEVAAGWGQFFRARETCPKPHRGPQGPNEDIGYCACGTLAWTMRPVGETFGDHLPDCSLPERHESYCVGGGTGHAPAERIRG